VKTSLVKYAATLVVVAICSACSGNSTGSTVAPSTAAFDAKYVGRTLFVNGRPVTAANLNPLPRFATLVPDGLRRHKKFEYVINFYGTYASIFDYPKSTDQIGTIYGLGGQGCTNVLYGYGKKIFWNPGRQNNEVIEYQVGTNKVLKMLPVTFADTSSCAMNTNGDLAVGVLDGTSSSGGQVVIFKNASGSGTVYNTPLSREFFDGYDPNGNLFADGFNSASSFGLVELPKGSSKAVTITTSNSPEFPGSVQWDGKYVSVFDQIANEFYQYTISGKTATLQHTITITGDSDCAQTWIVKNLVYCGDAGGAGEVYKYPAGGAPVATFTGNFVEPLGVVAAKK
jgi:hypothetical protein